MTPQERFDTWKEIANYLRRDVRTVQRWEAERNLPVHRMPGKRSHVYALRGEIDLWVGGTPPEHLATQPKARLRRPWALVSAVTLSLVFAAGFARFEKSSSFPRLETAVQLTSDGREERGLAATRAALFFVSSAAGRTTLTRLDLASGKQSVLPVPLNAFDLQDASPDGSRLLISDQGSQECNWPLWEVPANGSPSRRLKSVCAETAAWSPDGRKMAFMAEKGLYLSNADGSQPHRLLDLRLHASDLRWAPDGKGLRMVLWDSESPPGRLWEIELDSPAPRRQLPAWSVASDREEGGHWTRDGSFFVFSARHKGAFGLWAIREGWPGWLGRGPFQLMSSLNGVARATPSADGKKLFAVFAAPDRTEVMRFEPRLGRFVADPVFPISAAHAAFSPDSKQIAYAVFPAMDLWKMNVDGTGRMLITKHGVLPQWSPDGRRIAFMGANEDNLLPTKIGIISSGGGTPVYPIGSPEWQGVPSWTADGNALIFGENGPFFPIRAACSLRRFDIQSGQTFNLVGTTGLWTARACPAGRYVAAVTRDDKKLVLYDMKTTARTDLMSFADSPIGDNPTWSRDGKFIYVNGPASADPAVYRIGIADKHVERVASLKGVQRAHGNMGAWLGVTPDNLPLVLRQLQAGEIYAMDWVE